MKAKRYSEQEIVAILKRGETEEITVEQLCRETGINKNTYYRWKQQYLGLESEEVVELKKLREENGRLKRALADAMLDNQILKELSAKKW